jgi:hypothetical protein
LLDVGEGVAVETRFDLTRVTERRQPTKFVESGGAERNPFNPPL